MLTHLSLSSGGFNGCTILGALTKFNLSNLTHIAGTSVGAIIGLLLTFASLEDILDLMSIISLYSNEQVDILNIVNEFGLMSCQFMTDICTKLFNKYEVDVNINFADLYKVTHKHLTITGTNVTKAKLEYFNPDLTPHMSVLKAMEISMSVPFIFKHVKYNDCMYVDGGVMKHSPHCLFDDIKTENKLSIILNYFARDSHTFTTYISNLTLCILQRDDNCDDALIIVPKTVVSLVEDISSDRIKNMFDEGASQAEEYINAHSNQETLSHHR